MSEVPSNLIPTRITQLPTAPVADENSLMMIVYQGNNYQIRVGDLLSVAGVPTTTQIIAGTGMTGGGQLTGNVTLSVANGGIGTAQLASSGVTPGTYGDATNIPVFIVDATGRVMAATTVPASGGGGVPTTTEVIAGDGLSGGGQLTGNVTLTANLSDAIPLSIDTTGFAGVSLDISRADHQHPAIDLAADSQVDGLLGLNNGGTARSLVPEAGAMVWSGADGLYIGPAGSAGQVLISGGAGEPTWGSALVITDQAANLVYAGPTSGAAAPTSFRNLVNGDLPDSGAVANTYGSSSAIPVITLNSKGVITSITTAGISGGGVTSVNGDTGVVVLDYADVGAPSTSGTNATGTWGISISGNAATATTATTATSATTATNIAGGSTGSIPYQTSAGATSLLATASGVLVGGSTPSYSTTPSLTGTNFTSIPNAALTNSALTLGTTAVSLGATSLTLAGLTSVTVTQNPASNLQLATKQYVDSIAAAGIHYHDPVYVESPDTAGNLTATYAGGGTSSNITQIANGTDLTFSTGTPAIGDQFYVTSSSNGLSTGTQYWVTALVGSAAKISLTFGGAVITGLTDGSPTIPAVINPGVGATLTNAGTQVALTIDGVLMTVGKRVLIYNQTNGYENGIYTVTTVGTASTNWVLTRATDANTYEPSSPTALGKGDAFFVTAGSTGAGETYVVTTVGSIFFGVTSITFAQISATQVYSAGSGLTLTGTVFSITAPVSIANGGTNSTATATAGGAGYGTGTAHAYTAAGNAGEVLTSNGSSAPTWGGLNGGTF